MGKINSLSDNLAFKIKNIQSTKKYVEELCNKNLYLKYKGQAITEAKLRLDEELRVIDFQNYYSILALASLVCDKSREFGYPVFTNGMIGNLLVSYLLDITDVDPISHKLYPEMAYDVDGSAFVKIGINVAAEIVWKLSSYISDCVKNSYVYEKEKCFKRKRSIFNKINLFL